MRRGFHNVIRSPRHRHFCSNESTYHKVEVVLDQHIRGSVQRESIQKLQTDSYFRKIEVGIEQRTAYTCKTSENPVEAELLMSRVWFSQFPPFVPRGALPYWANLRVGREIAGGLQLGASPMHRPISASHRTHSACLAVTTCYIPGLDRKHFTTNRVEIDVGSTLVNFTRKSGGSPNVSYRSRSGLDNRLVGRFAGVASVVFATHPSRSTRPQQAYDHQSFIRPQRSDTKQPNCSTANLARHGNWRLRSPGWISKNSLLSASCQHHLPFYPVYRWSGSLTLSLCSRRSSHSSRTSISRPGTKYASEGAIFAAFGSGELDIGLGDDLRPGGPTRPI